MNGDNGQYEYDELRWLARDTHRSRRRAVWWTAGLTLGAMTLATVYVQREPATTTGPASPPGPSTTTYSVTPNLTTIETRLADINRSLGEIRDKLPGTLNFAVYSDPSVAGTSNLIWLVEGSRRFPMTNDDILWIRDAQMWVRAIDLAEDQRTVRIWGPNRDPEPMDAANVIPLPAGDRAWFELSQIQGNANCVTLEWLGPSNRLNVPRGVFFDIDVVLEPRDPAQCMPIP